MEEYEIELYEKANGICPVAEFLDDIDVLAKHNINLREPLVKPIDEGIFELRTQQGNDVT